MRRLRSELIPEPLRVNDRGAPCVCPCRCMTWTFEGVCRFCWSWHQAAIQQRVAELVDEAAGRK